MSKDEVTVLKWLGIAVVLILIIYFATKLIDAITHPAVVWFIIGMAAIFAAEGIAWCIYWWKWRTWRFWRQISMEKKGEQRDCKRTNGH